MNLPRQGRCGVFLPYTSPPEMRFLPALAVLAAVLTSPCKGQVCRLSVAGLNRIAPGNREHPRGMPRVPRSQCSVRETGASHRISGARAIAISSTDVLRTPRVCWTTPAIAAPIARMGGTSGTVAPTTLYIAPQTAHCSTVTMRRTGDHHQHQRAWHQVCRCPGAVPLLVKGRWRARSRRLQRCEAVFERHEFHVIV